MTRHISLSLFAAIKAAEYAELMIVAGDRRPVVFDKIYMLTENTELRQQRISKPLKREYALRLNEQPITLSA